MDWLILILLSTVLPGEPDLARRLKRQEPEALAALYDTYSRVVYRLILHIVRDPATSEDILQDTFTKVWNSAHQIDADSAQIGPWVMTIARNRALDFLRSSNSRTALHDAFSRTEDHFTSVTAEESLITSENVRRVANALKTLNPNQRQVIELAYYRGLSQTQIAEQLNQPLGTVKSWARSALQHLRSALQSEGRWMTHV